MHTLKYYRYYFLLAHAIYLSTCTTIVSHTSLNTCIPRREVATKQKQNSMDYRYCREIK